MIEIGAFHEAWGSIHLEPKNALATHQRVKAKTMMPVYRGTFSLALHDWDEPIATLLELADKAGVQLLSPMMGQSVHRESRESRGWRVVLA